jgi:hypothetical protein
VGERVERFCRDRALILPAARLQLGLHDVVVRSSGLVGGFAALSRVVSLDSVISATAQVPGSPAWARAEVAAAGERPGDMGPSAAASRKRSGR